MSTMSELHQTVQLLKSKYLRKAGPPRPGLVPQSGDSQHPGRWVKPESMKTAPEQSNETQEEVDHKTAELFSRYHAVQDETEELWALLGTHKVNEKKVKARIKKLEAQDDEIRSELSRLNPRTKRSRR